MWRASCVNDLTFTKRRPGIWSLGNGGSEIIKNIAELRVDRVNLLEQDKKQSNKP